MLPRFSVFLQQVRASAVPEWLNKRKDHDNKRLRSLINRSIEVIKRGRQMATANGPEKIRDPLRNFRMETRAKGSNHW